MTPAEYLAEQAARAAASGACPEAVQILEDAAEFAAKKLRNRDMPEDPVWRPKDTAPTEPTGIERGLPSGEAD